MSVTITNTTLPTLLYMQAPFSLFASVTSGDWDTESPNRYSVSRKQVRLGNSLMCFVEGGVCIVSVDFLSVPVANSERTIGTLPNGMKPLGHAANEQTGSDEVAYIAPLRYRGNNSIYGQLMVKNSGKISVYVSHGGSNYAYYYGQLVFPVTRS